MLYYVEFLCPSFISDVQANPRMMKVPVSSDHIFKPSPSCVINSNAEINVNSPFAVLISGITAPRGTDIRGSLVSNNQAGADDGDYRINVHVFLGKDETIINTLNDKCVIDMKEAYVSREIDVKVEGTKISFLLDTVIKDAIKDLSFKIHRALLIHFTPVSNTPVSARLAQNTAMEFVGSYEYRKKKPVLFYFYSFHIYAYICLFFFNFPDTLYIWGF